MSAPADTTRYLRRPVSVPANFPVPDASMFHGVIGDLARSVEELSEADLVGIVGSLLAYVSAVVGRDDCLTVSGQKFRPAAELLGQRLRAARAGTMKASTSGWHAWLDHRERDSDEWIRSRRAGHLGCLALVYVLADGASEVTGEHIEEAEAVCDYAEASAASIFGPLSGDLLAQRVLDAVLSQPRGMTLTELQRRCANHLTPADRNRVVAKLVKAGLIEKRVESTRGRPRVWLTAVESATQATRATKAVQRPVGMESA